MSTGTVSVVIPTKDRAPLLARTLTSVLVQRGVDVEVVVVDDGSRVGELDGVAQLSDPRVQLVRHDAPLGVSAARNAGIRRSTGRWVAFVDDDDLWAPDKLSAQLASLAEAPSCRWGCVGVVTVDAALRIIGWRRPPARPDVAAEMLAGDSIPGGGSGLIAERELLDAVGLFDPGLACNADWDLCLRLSQESPLASVDRPLVAYCLHAGGMSLDVDLCAGEYHRMAAKYAAARAARGVHLDDRRWGYWEAATHLRAGHRARSLRTLARVARHRPEWPRIGRYALMAVLPGSVALRNAWQSRRVPVWWRAEAEAWLRPFRWSPDPARPA